MCNGLRGRSCRINQAAVAVAAAAAAALAIAAASHRRGRKTKALLKYIYMYICICNRVESELRVLVVSQPATTGFPLRRP